MESGCVKVGTGIGKIIGYNKSALFPILVLGAFLVYFFSVSDFSEENYHAVHGFFVGCVGLTLLVMGYFRILSSVMMASVIYTGYLVINSLRYTYGEDYIFRPGIIYGVRCCFPIFCWHIFFFTKDSLINIGVGFIFFCLLRQR